MPKIEDSEKNCFCLDIKTRVAYSNKIIVFIKLVLPRTTVNIYYPSDIDSKSGSYKMEYLRFCFIRFVSNIYLIKS